METDSPSQVSLGRQILDTVRRMFVSGILVTVPVIVTVVVLHFLFRQIDGLLSPVLEQFLGYSIPGMGLIATLALILLAGILVRNVIGSRVFAFWELLLIRTPLVRAVYSAAKQLVEAVAVPERKAFDRPVLIEYPRRGSYAVGFRAAHTQMTDGPTPGELIAIFVPNTPTPVTGFVILVPKDEVYELGISNEEAIKMLVSGGIATPPTLDMAESSARALTEAQTL